MSQFFSLRSRIAAILLVLGGFTLAGCGGEDVTTKTRAGLLGIWLGHGQPGEINNIVYLINFRDDGTFTSDFREYEGCNVSQNHIESGTWSVKENVQDIVTTVVDGQKVNFTNVYTIERLTPTEHDARLKTDNYLFSVTRADKFEFPPCREGT